MFLNNIKMKVFFWAILLTAAVPNVYAESENRPGSQNDVVWKAIYSQHFNELFDQSKVIITKEYQAASGDEKEDLLEKHFKNKRAKFYEDLFKGHLVSVGTMVATGLVAGYYTRQKLVPLFADMNVGQAGVAAGGFSVSFAVLSAWLWWPVTSALNWTSQEFQSLWAIFKDLYIAPYLYQRDSLYKDDFDAVEIAYARKKAKLPPAVIVRVEKAIKFVRTQQSIGEAVLTLKEAELLINNVLNMPTEIKQIKYAATLFEEVFKCYPDNNKQEIKRLMVRHIVGGREKDGRRYASFFYGEPGVGKTWAARHLAEVLGIELIEIPLAQVTMKELIGDDKNPGLVVGGILKAVQKGNKFKNVMMLFDDGDRVMNSVEGQNFLLQFLDPDRSSFYSEYLGVDVDLSGVGVIITGNFELKDIALKNRLQTIVFERRTDECTKAIVWDHFFPEIFARYETSEFSLAKEDFTEKDRAQFDKVIEENKDPGLRVIYRKLEAYVQDLVIDKIEKKYLKKE